CCVSERVSCHLAVQCFPARRSSDLLKGSAMGGGQGESGGAPGAEPGSGGWSGGVGKPMCLVSEVLLGGESAANCRLVGVDGFDGDRKSTRLNSSHVKMSYAVFSLNK